MFEGRSRLSHVGGGFPGVAAAALGLLVMLLGRVPASAAAEHKYVEQTGLLLIYKHYVNHEETKPDGSHPQRHFTDTEVETFKAQPAIISDYFWRASHFRIHPKHVKTVVVDAELTQADLKESWLDAARVHRDYSAAGLKDGDIHLIWVVWPIEPTDKYFNWAGGLPGATGQEAFFTKTRLDVSAYEHGRDISQAHWTMLHEQQHVYDDTFGIVSGKGWGDHPYRNPDVAAENMPWPVDNAASGNFLMSVEVPERDWFDLVPPYMTHKTLPDKDGDGLPDSGEVPVSEQKLGTRCSDRASDRDSDGDGISDRDEAMGDYSGGYDPTSADTDGDGISDGVDFVPRCPSVNWLPRKTATLDGTIGKDEYAEFSTFRYDAGLSGKMYAAWEEGKLHLAAAIEDDEIVVGQKESDNPDDPRNDGLQWMFDIDGDGYVATKADLGLLNYVVWIMPAGEDGNTTVYFYEHLEGAGWCEKRRAANNGITARYMVRAGGYDVEVCIPERALPGATLKLGRGLRFAQYVLDCDGGRTVRCDAALPHTYDMNVPYFMKVELGDPFGKRAMAARMAPPTPDPPTFAVKPHWAGDKIVMTATAGKAGDGRVEYCFVECLGQPGRKCSGWTTDLTFEVTGADPKAEYRYGIYMRDAAGQVTSCGAETCAAKIPHPKKEE
ncbi:MAG TPA: hypothetical protein PKY77_05565 [Phycisphaerae bacterium]|nr:hypothetical protein [Phycisphaerae bacterium]HRY69089.1 hypothetical protein [Phycisphaerae bacterium]HSA25936.1 hypothetical protein [Phycisphaerae bacterium]